MGWIGPETFSPACRGFFLIGNIPRSINSVFSGTRYAKSAFCNRGVDLLKGAGA
jgi:hypothetical protein